MRGRHGRWRRPATAGNAGNNAGVTSAAEWEKYIAGFRDGLKEAGFVDGAMSQSTTNGRNAITTGNGHGRCVRQTPC